MYKLNDIDLTTYGILAGKPSSGNVAIEGCYSMPSRTGDCYYEWPDSLEGFTAADDIMFGGRNLVFNGIIISNNFDLYYKLKAFYAAIALFSDLVVLSSPYGDYSVQITSVEETHNTGGCWLKINMREPVVDLTGGTLPATGIGAYTIDDIPFHSFGLHIGKSDKVYNLPELKEQYFTKYGQEGYQMVYHKNRVLTLDGIIVASSVAEFTTNIKNLYLAFASTGERTIKKNNEVFITCFAKDGFEVKDLMVFENLVVGNFSIELMVTGFMVNGDEYLLATEDDELIIDEDEEFYIDLGD